MGQRIEIIGPGQADIQIAWCRLSGTLATHDYVLAMWVLVNHHAQGKGRVRIFLQCLHDCRRIFLNRLRDAGVPLETAMALTAHKDVRTVQKHYREVGDRDLREGIERLDGAPARSVERTGEDA